VSVLSLALLGCVLLQQHRLADLRAEQARRNTEPQAAAQPIASDTQSSGSDTVQLHQGVSPELLKLRDHVHRLNLRRDELASVALENQRLKQQLASGATNRAAAANFIRTSQARFAGYDSPEQTLESFLWAVQNKDIAMVLEAFTPEARDKAQRSFEGGGQGENPLEALAQLPGLSVISTEHLADDKVAAQVQLTPDIPPQRMVFRKIRNQWKLSEPGL
jgi:hypothetical protein